MDASTSDYVGYWYANISPFFFLHLDLSPAVRIHRADESKGASPLTPQNFITLHNIGQKYLADKGDKAKTDFWNYHAVTRTSKGKVDTYLKEYKYRVSILQETPRAAADQEQEVVGLFRTYNAGASFTNQEPAPVNMTLAFTEAHVTYYETKSVHCAQVVASLSKLTGDILVRKFVALCAIELKFLYGCSVPWDKLPDAGQSPCEQGSDPASVPASPKRTQAPSPKAPSPKTKSQALSSGDEDDEDGGEYRRG